MNTMTAPETTTGTIGDLLDRLEALVGRIGFNTRDQALSLLHGLDQVEERINAIENSDSRRRIKAQREGIYGKLRTEAAGFLKDLGGGMALASERSKVQPPEDNWWWFLDDYLAANRRASLRRALIGGGVALAVLAILAVVYNVFLAPDPVTAAVYTAENSSRELLAGGDYESALRQVEEGLRHDPQAPTLLVTKGVILEAMGRKADAAQAFAQAEQFSPDREAYLVTRGQTYIMINQPDKALADAEAVMAENPKSAQAQLLAGSVYESRGQFQEALKAYDLAYNYASEADQTELAALVRYRTAMLMQSMQVPVTTPQVSPPAP